MKKLSLLLLLGASMMLTTTLADSSIKFELDTVSGWTQLQNFGGNPIPGGAWQTIDPGFMPMLSSMRMWFKADENTLIFGDYYLSSHGHLGRLYSGEGYILLSQVPKNTNFFGINDVMKSMGLELKAGFFELDYGNWRHMRTKAARNDTNPLNGNPAVDQFFATEGGAEVIGHVGKQARWVVGLSNNAPNEQWTTGRNFGYHTKVQFDDDNMNIAFSYARALHTGSYTGNGSELTSTTRSDQPYFGVEVGGAQTGQMSIGKGYDATCYQVDLGTQLMGVKWYGHLGYAEDLDTNNPATAGTLPSKMTYGMLQGVLPIDGVIKDAWLTGRFSFGATDMYFGTAMNAQVLRAQAGYGMKLNDEGWTLKAEYVYNLYRNFLASASAVDYTNGPGFNGLTLAVSAPLVF